MLRVVVIFHDDTEIDEMVDEADEQEIIENILAMPRVLVSASEIENNTGVVIFSTKGNKT